MNRKVRLAVNIAGLNIGWFACVLGAAGGYPSVGPVVVAGLIGTHLLLAPNRKQEAALILLVGVLGTLADSLQMAAGTLGFQDNNGSSMIIPLWMIALWLNFATGLTVALYFLVGRPVLASALGLLGGSSAYYSGTKLGALSFPIGPWQGALVVGLAWAVFLPLMTRMAAISRDAHKGDGAHLSIELNGKEGAS